MEYKIGDIVQLKSGGPRMTIVEIDSWKRRAFIMGRPSPEYEKDEAKCFWFEGNKKFEDIFSLKSLTILGD